MECIICGKANDGNTFWNLENDNDISSFEGYIFSSWKRECITATCQVLFDNKSEHFVDYFLNAKYCSCCEQVIRDVGFTWKQIKSFQKQIFQLSRKIFNLLDTHYNQIEEKSEADVVADRISTLSLLKNESSDFSNYSIQEMVEIIFALVSNPKNSDDPDTHSFGSSPFITPNWTQQADAEVKINTDNSIMRTESLCSLKTEGDDDMQDISSVEEGLLVSFEEENSIEDHDNSDIDNCDVDINKSEISFSLNRYDDNNITINENDTATENSKQEISLLETIESKDKSLKCPFENCNSYFDTKNKQQTHFYLTHEFAKPYICPGCPQKFIHEDNLISHMKIAHDKLVYSRCSFCGILYKNEEQLTFHYSNAHQQSNPFKCAFCDEVFKSREYLINHTIKSHSNYIKEKVSKPECPHCQRKVRRRDLNRHIRLNHSSVLGDGGFECNFCGRKYVKEKDLKSHYCNSHQDDNRFQCPICFELYTNSEDLTLHTKDKHPKLQFICNLCGYNFVDRRGLTRHSFKDHKYKCSVCEMKFTIFSMFKSHTEQEHKQKLNLECEECGKVFITDKSFLQHKRRVHTEKGHKCYTCGIFLPTKSELKDHKWSVHENPMDSGSDYAEECQNPFVCGICPKTFNKYVTLRKHVKVFHGNANTVGNFKCCVCGSHFTALRYLDDHRKRCRPSLPSCKFCGKGYNTEDELNVHCSEAHKGPNPFTCAFCPEIFNNSGHLTRHTKQVHSDPESLVTKFKCDVCGVYRSSKSSLNRHSLTHLDPSLVFKCNICHTPFKDNEKLEKHISVVHVQQQYICDSCGKIFKALSHLKSHLKIHDKTSIKVQCNVCDKMFIDKLTCTQHEKTHTDIKDFFCDICGKGFINKDNLKEHRKIHTGEPTRKRNRYK